MSEFLVGAGQAWDCFFHLLQVNPQAAVNVSSTPLLEFNPVAVHHDVHRVVTAHHHVLDKSFHPVVKHPGCNHDIVSDNLVFGVWQGLKKVIQKHRLPVHAMDLSLSEEVALLIFYQMSLNLGDKWKVVQHSSEDLVPPL